MKKLIVLVLLCGALHASATDKKRPSWSQGLPERPKAPSRQVERVDSQENRLQAPVFDNISVEDSLVPMTIGPSDSKPIEAKPTVAETTTIEEQAAVQTSDLSDLENSAQESVLIDQFDQPVVEPATQVVNDNEFIETASRPVVQTQMFSQALNDPKSSYSWSITRQFPVKVSPFLLNQQSSVIVKVMINNVGEVVAVDRVLEATPDSLIEQAERSVKRWRFKAPAKEGIDEPLLSKVMKISLSARS